MFLFWPSLQQDMKHWSKFFLPINCTLCTCNIWHNYLNKYFFHTWKRTIFTLSNARGGGGTLTSLNSPKFIESPPPSKRGTKFMTEILSDFSGSARVERFSFVVERTALFAVAEDDGQLTDRPP